MDWFWIAVVLWLLGAANSFLYSVEEMREVAKEVIEEMEREDDFARVSGWMRSDFLFWTVMTVEAVFWPFWMALDLVRTAFKEGQG